MKSVKESISTKIDNAIRNFCNFLTILFCVLRACDVITWEWYWVMSPYFVCWMIGVILLIVAGALTTAAVADKDK